MTITLLASTVKTVPVVVALRDIPPYSKVSLSDVAVKEVPKAAVPDTAITRIQFALGCVTLGRVIKGQMLMKGHLASPESEAGLSWDLPEDTRAMFIPATFQKALGGRVKKGEAVDLIWAPRARTGAETGGVTILEGVTVIEPVKESNNGEFVGVVALVPRSSCEQLAFCLENGSVYLALVPRREVNPLFGSEEASVGR